MSEESNSSQWHLNKSVPITLIATLVLQAVVFIWFVAGLDSQVQKNKEDIDDLYIQVSLLTTTVQNQAIILARLDENVKYIRDSLEGISNGN